MTEIKVLAEIVNLKQARKRRARAQKDAKAKRNRLAFGRTKAERRRDEAEQARSRRLLERHRLESDED